jgi:hypothetical protein
MSEHREVHRGAGATKTKSVFIEAGNEKSPDLAIGAFEIGAQERT